LNPRKTIMTRIYIVYGAMCLFALAVAVKAGRIVAVEGEMWRQKAQELTTQYQNIEAARGNIFAEDGSLLATSKPIYEVRWDVNTPHINKETFNAGIGPLSQGLAKLFPEKSAQTWKRELTTARNNGSRYFLIKRDVEYKQLRQMRELPLFELGQYRGGLISIQKSRRAKPFRELAARTIGYDRPGYQVGLEGAFADQLAGVGGKRLMQRIAGGVWKPIPDATEIEPTDGADLITTLDVNIQDVAQHALETQLTNHNAQSGCAILMEVATGDIKAIANLTLQEDGSYKETFNYAIGAATEPGSTFKLVSMLALLEDSDAQLTDSVDISWGRTRFYDREMKDSKTDLHKKLTVAEVFEKSSNVGTAVKVNELFAKSPDKWIAHVRALHMDRTLGIGIGGEAKPVVKDPADKKHWYGTTIPWMSIGYEVMVSPMHILTLYNAVANNGTMVRPRLVKSITRHGQVEREFPVEVLNPRICSPSTVARLRLMMEGVVEHGTAQNLKHADYKIAGKTGTAQIAKDGGYKKSGITYQASFVGYFPAHDPKYTCMVVVNAPSNHVYYANVVAGPIFKEISDKVYSTRIDILEELAQDTAALVQRRPLPKNGKRTGVEKVLAGLGVPYRLDNNDNEWATAQTDGDTVRLTQIVNDGQGVPRVTGMGARDAIYLLENAGLRVVLRGSGTVRQQSILPGTRIVRGTPIVIELS